MRTASGGCRSVLARSNSHGRLEVAGTVEAYVEEVSSRVAIRPLTAKIAVLAKQLPAYYSSDPCDRLIAATALAEGMTLVTTRAGILAGSNSREGRQCMVCAT